MAPTKKKQSRLHAETATEEVKKNCSAAATLTSKKKQNKNYEPTISQPMSGRLTKFTNHQLPIIERRAWPGRGVFRFRRSEHGFY